MTPQHDGAAQCPRVSLFCVSVCTLKRTCAAFHWEPRQTEGGTHDAQLQTFPAYAVACNFNVSPSIWLLCITQLVFSNLVSRNIITQFPVCHLVLGHLAPLRKNKEMPLVFFRFKDILLWTAWCCSLLLKQFLHCWHAVIILTSVSKFNIETHGGIFGLSPGKDHKSCNVKTPQRWENLKECATCFPAFWQHVWVLQGW